MRFVRANTLSYIIVIAVVFLFLNCKKIVRPNIDSPAEFLVKQAADTVYKNKTVAKLLLDSAFKAAKDSVDYYKVYSGLIEYNLMIFNFDSVHVMTEKLIRFLNKQEDGEFKNVGLAYAYDYLGIYVDQTTSNLDSAIFFYNKSYQYLLQSENKVKLPDILINLADMYIRSGRYVQGIGYFRQALKTGDSLKLEDEIHFPVYFGLGQAYYMGLRNFELSDYYFRLAETDLDKRRLGEKFTFCNNRGNFYYYKKDYESALPWFRKARELVIPGNFQFNIQLCNGNMGDVFLHLNMTDSAQKYLNESYNYFKKSGNIPVINYLTTALSGLALKQNKLVEAKRYIGMFDNSIPTEPEFLMIRYKYLQVYYIHRNDYRQAYLYREREDALNDSIRSERVNARIEESEIRYRKDTTIMKKQLLIAEQNNTIENLKFTNWFWFMFSVSILLLTGYGYTTLKRRREKMNRASQEQITKLRFESIKNRLSPHFIFNQINAEISSEEDKEKYKNLLNLTTLLRQSLLISEKISVSLTAEIEFVQTYIELESGRLGPDFSCKYNFEKTIDFDNVSLPPMIIQIPVENAIKHALRPKIGYKILEVNIKKSSVGVIITIVDNGVGFIAESGTKPYSTGTGLKVLNQTISILNKKNKDKMSLHIRSRRDGESGTAVEIFIPNEFKYKIS